MDGEGKERATELNYKYVLHRVEVGPTCGPKCTSQKDTWNIITGRRTAGLPIPSCHIVAGISLTWVGCVLLQMLVVVVRI